VHPTAATAGDGGGGGRGGERRRRVSVGAAVEAAVALSDPGEAVVAGGDDGEFGGGMQRSGGDVRFHEEEERGGRTHVRSKGLGCQRRCRSVRVRRQTHGRSCFSQPLGVTPTVLYTICSKVNWDSHYTGAPCSSTQLPAHASYVLQLVLRSWVCTHDC